MTTPSFIPSLPNSNIFPGRKKIYKFQYETSKDFKPFHGYLNPSCDYSIMSLKRLHEHGLDESKLPWKPVTNLIYARDNKFGNIVGMYELEIFFGGRTPRIGSVGIGYDVGGSETGIPSPYRLYNNNERKINVLMLKESAVDFRLGTDFISNHNIVIEPKGRNSNNKGKFPHQFKFEDGLTVDLEEIEDGHHVDNSDEEDGNVDTGDKIVKNSNYNNESYKKFKKILMSRSGLYSIIIFLTFLIIILCNSYATSQSLLEELVVLPYNKKLTRPGIENKLEDYARKLKIATSVLELFELDKPQIPKRSTTPHEGEGEGEGKGEREGGGGGGGGDTGSQELYTNLIQFTENIDNTKRTLLNTYNQEVSYFGLFQQNIKNLLKYLKKKSYIFWTRSIPLKNFDLLVNDIETVIINNIDLVTNEVNATNSYCDEIMFQVEKMINELEVFIVDSSKPFSSWLNALIRFTRKKGGNIDNLGEIDYATALKVKKLLLALNNDLFEISIFFTDLKSYLNNYSRDLLVFLEHFRSRITDWEINTIKNHLVKLQTNRDNIFDEILVNDNISGDNEPFVGCRIRENDQIIECSG